MKRFLVSASMMAMLMGGLALQSLRAAEDEVKGAVPARTDANNPDSAVYRASDIMNMPVKDDDGAEVGHIKDLVINGESREVLYAVVAMKDAKEKDSVYIMPWQVFQPYYGQGTTLQYTVLTVPQSVWIQAPFYSLNQWRTVRYSQWAPRVNTYFASHINVNQRGGRATGVKAAKPAINDEDVKDNSKRNDRTDKKSDSDKKNDSDKKSDTDKKNDSDRDRSDSKDRNDKPAPKNDSPKDAPTPKPAPTPVPKTETPAPKAQNPVPNAPKVPAVPQPRDPKAAPK